MGYEQPRKIWAQFRAGLEAHPEVLAEFLMALRVVLNEYHTSVRENRFIVGGAAERLTAIAMRAVGLRSARARGLSLDEEDLVVGGVQLSLKCSFTGKTADIRLINALGSADGRAWNVPTIFLLAARGVGYADRELLPDAVRSTGDALILRGKALAALHASQPRYLLACDLPSRPADPYSRRAASEAIVRDIVLRTETPKFPLLRHHL